MVDEPIDVVVLADEAGNYYLFSHESVRRARVPAERKAEIDEMMRGADVSGFAAPVSIPKGADSLQLRFVTLGQFRSQAALDSLQNIRVPIKTVPSAPGP